MAPCGSTAKAGICHGTPRVCLPWSTWAASARHHGAV